MAPPLIRRLKLLILIGVLFCALPVFALCASYAKPADYIRVAIIQDTPSLRLKVKGFFTVVNLRNLEIIRRGKQLNTTVTAYKGGILLGEIKSSAEKILLKADNPESIIINGRRFRGNIRLIKKDNAHLLVINEIALEDYVKGVLYHEVSHYWPQEALKAQAVACRSYAVYQAQAGSAQDYDVTADIYSQVYGGKTSERYRTNKAVDETKGEILAFQGKVFPAYFHATCGGRTEDASVLWNIDLPPLKGVNCGFCRDSPHFNWHLVLSLGKIEENLTGAGKKIKKIQDIMILGRDKSGRVSDLKINADKDELKISAKDFRNIIGPNLIKSANFTVQIVNHDAVFEGLGWGHGVGLCQWGAYFMAKQGKNYKDILQYYYPGSDVKAVGF